MTPPVPSNPTNEVPAKLCNFRGCTSPAGTVFPMCETCRVIYASERVTLLSDPFSSRATNVKDAITAQLITAMSGAEVLNLQANLQYLYLEICKIVKLHGLEPAVRRVTKTLAEQVEDARSTQRNVESVGKATKRKQAESLTKLQKQMKALGCVNPTGRGAKPCEDCDHAAQAKRIFNDDSSEIGF